MTSSVPPIELSENHRRSISISLQLVDKAFCEWEEWARGRVHSGIIYREDDTLSPEQKDALRQKVSRVRELLTRLRDDLQLETKVLATSQAIVGQSAVLWEMLADLNSRGLSGYGNVPDELGTYLDPIGETLCEEMNAIARLFSQPNILEGKE